MDVKTVTEKASSTLSAVNCITVDELNDGDSCIGHGIQLAKQHLQNVLVGKKHTGKMKTDGQRMRLWR